MTILSQRAESLDTVATVLPEAGRGRDRYRSARGGERARRALTYVGLAVWLLLSIAPVMWGLSGSFKRTGDLFAPGSGLIPADPTLDNYKNLLTEVPFAQWFITSLVIATVSSVVATFTCALVGYGLAKYRFRGQGLIFGMVLSALMIPFAVILIPLFVEVSSLGLTNQYLAYVIPFLCPAFGVFLMRQFIVGVPDELSEAARIDGVSEFGIFMRIVLPIIRPAIGALFVWMFLQAYNDFLWPNTVMNDAGRYTLTLGLNSLRTSFATDYSMILAGTMLAAIPTVILFILLRKQLIEGLTSGAVKG
ncbi:carbohydrate ABC transporter permease [Microbacterium sp. H1-D42]|uniref:carbohydrate ABC transporter permease n=1 Tax=Microbacterium sp. H1-D42 TaxID=2925844 RepID=UPI001F532D86|nr:carbohydrate ABC transporter permease [Microbacterium sp. H1-D42]UNK70464.1 carbohydrate ABC transporter permease [Microbacterium sp. H1-D42]